MMRHWLHQMIPSMFRRRLLLLALLAVCILGMLGAQVAHLTLGQGQNLRRQAESALSERRLIPTVRGRILDGRGRVLAEDRGSFDVRVLYPVISGEWAYRQARWAAYQANRDRWHRLDRVEQEQLIARFQPAFQAQVEHLWQTLAQLGHVSPQEIQDRKSAIVARVEMVAADVWARQVQAAHRHQAQDRQRYQWLGLSLADDDATPQRPDFRPISEQQAPHSILRDVKESTRVAVQRLIWQAGQADAPADLAVWKAVSVDPSWHRVYPLEDVQVSVDRSAFPGPLRNSQPAEVAVSGVGLQIIGKLRDVWREDIDGVTDPQTGRLIKPGRPFRTIDAAGHEVIDLGGYLPGDQVGQWGIEETWEKQLRGRRGQVVEYLDTGREKRVEPVPGQDIQLSIDAALQARIQAIMSPALGLTVAQPWQHHATEEAPRTKTRDGEVLNGCAVVLDIASGDVLAAVSLPTFSLQELKRDPQAVWGDPVNRPYVDRAVAWPYEPGSTIKPLVLAAATTEGKYKPGEIITCNGFLDPNHPNQFRCWIFKEYGQTHGPETGPTALRDSCNIFFYTLGRRLGPSHIVWWFRHFHLGEPTGCGLDDEIGGDVPPLKPDGSTSRNIGPVEATLMGIGQGPVRWTPVQAVAVYAALARGGYWMAPSFIRAVGGKQLVPKGEDLHLDPRGVAMALDGLDLVVNDPRGTANHLPMLGDEKIFTLPGVHVIGKSGTATAAPLRIDSNHDGRITQADQIVRTGDHAWFIGMVRRDDAPRPQYVVAVVMEYGGSGGAVAAPIANQILYAMRAEGYL